MIDMTADGFLPKPKNLNLAAAGFTVNMDPYPNKVITSKYKAWSFVFVNFFNQISKGSTLFFFITAILLLIPGVSPFEPFSYLSAFFLVIGVSMLKDGMEDYRRHKDDDQLNKTKVKTVRCKTTGGNTTFHIIEKNCMELDAGDFIILKRDEEVHADVLVLRAMSFYKDKLVCNNHCFIETSSLDGESNLKKKSSFKIPKRYPCCRHKMDHPVESYGALVFSPCYEYFFTNINSFDLKDTGEGLNEFECDLNLNGTMAIADDKNVLYRGSVVKNTEYCLCLVVGVGNNTKMSKNQHKVQKNKTLFDERLGVTLRITLGLYLLIMLFTIISGGIFILNNNEKEYLDISSFGSAILNLILSNYILYMYLVPLSLYVMLELAMFVHSYFISNDQSMKYNGVQSNCRNSNALADLGMIDYILTDKTGTITKNSMTLKYIHRNQDDKLVDPELMCSNFNKKINRVEGGSLDEKIKRILENNDLDLRNDLLFILNLLICNSVEILNKKAEGISQEELSFLDSIQRFGFYLFEREEKYVIVQMLGQKIKIPILGTLEFTSKRQRMGVVVNICESIYLLTKGSDQKLLDKEKDSRIFKILNASTDFRSLVLKYKKLSLVETKDFLESIKIDFSDSTDPENDALETDNSNHLKEIQKMQEKAFKVLEVDTEYIGSVFIEDELQNGVENTMKSLHEAGIKVWMITGDKRETAVSCAKNSCIIEDSNYVSLCGSEAIRMIENYKNNIAPRRRSMSQRLFEIFGLENEQADQERSINDNHNIFSKSSVVIYRATPSQKGNIARLFRELNKNTLAIGDGNNDVSMLKNSHIGVGIMGKEGNQAALSADFAIPQFNLLSNLLFSYGRFCFQRYTKLALNTYGKNIFFVFIQFIYNLYNGSSGRSLSSSFFFNYYNVVFTSMIPFSIALFDQSIDNERAINEPGSYKNVRTQYSNFFIWLSTLFSILLSTLIFIVNTFLASNDISNGSGILVSHVGLTLFFTLSLIFGGLLRQLRLISYRTIYTNLAIGLTVLLNVLSIFLLEDFYIGGTFLIYYMLVCPYFYFAMIASFSIIYVADTLYEQVNMHVAEKYKKSVIANNKW